MIVSGQVATLSRQDHKFTSPYLYLALSGISSPVTNEDVRHKHATAIGQFFYHNQRRNGIYGVRFVICELFNIVNVFVQIYLIDRLLGGEFSTYGLKVGVFLYQP